MMQRFSDLVEFHIFFIADNNAYWGQHIPFRIPSQEFGMPLAIHGAYLTSNRKNSASRVDEKIAEIPPPTLPTSNHGVDPRFSFCSYPQGTFPPTEHNQITQTTPAVLNIFGQLNSHNIIKENAYKFSNSANDGTLVLPCNCTAAMKQPYDLIEMQEKKEDKSRSDEKSKYITKTFNNNLEKKIRKETASRFKIQNSIQPHSTNFQDIRVSVQTTGTYIVSLG